VPTTFSLRFILAVMVLLSIVAACIVKYYSTPVSQIAASLAVMASCPLGLFFNLRSNNKTDSSFALLCVIFGFSAVSGVLCELSLIRLSASNGSGDFAGIGDVLIRVLGGLFLLLLSWLFIVGVWFRSGQGKVLALYLPTMPVTFWLILKWVESH